MIQRIQTLFLVIAAAISIVTFWVSFGEKTDVAGEMHALTLMGVNANGPNYELILINGLVFVLAVVAIFNFKKRAFQMKLCRLGSLLSIALLVLAFYACESLVGEGKVEYQLGIYLNAVQPVLFFVARRFIYKDDLLVKSADRIR